MRWTITMLTDVIEQTATVPPDLWPTLLSWGPPAAVLGFILWLIYTGKLYTKGEMSRVIEMYEGRIKEWKERYEESEQRGQVWQDQSKQNTESLQQLTHGTRPTARGRASSTAPDNGKREEPS